MSAGRQVSSLLRPALDPPMLTALILSAGADTGGQNVRWKHAADRLGGVRIRAVHTTDGYMRYPHDIRWQGNAGAVQRLYDAADVIHLNNRPFSYFKMDGGQRKPVLLHHHGSAFRSDPRRLLDVAKRHRWVQAVSTIDLLKPAPATLQWLPTAYDAAELARIGAESRRPDDGMVRIAHAPTSRQVKSTDALIAAVDVLRAEGLPVELDVIEGVSNAECIRRKATADIYFDQVLLGYGCNAVEAWGAGIPVIAGAAPWTLDRMTAEFDGVLPFYAATEDTIADALRTLVMSADARAEYAAKGTAHVERFHAEAPALARLIDLYEQAVSGKRRRRPSSTRAA